MHGEIVATDMGHRLEFTRELPAPADRVWRMLIDPQDRATWLFDGILEPWVGGLVDLADDYHRITGRVTACSPPNLLSLTWSSSDAPQGEVRFEVTALTAETCRLRLVHIVGTDGKPRSLAAGWHALLDRLHTDLAGASLDDCPSFADLVREYDERPIAQTRRP